MSIPLHLGPLSFVIDLVALALLAVVVVLSVFAVRAATRRNTLLPYMAALFVCLDAFAVDSTLAPQRVWPLIWAAYWDVDAPKRSDLAADLKQKWIRYSMPVEGDIRAVDWLLLSYKWGVCHELWPQSDCVHASTPRASLGLARAYLRELADGA
jgi:hypothetical protein